MAWNCGLPRILLFECRAWREPDQFGGLPLGIGDRPTPLTRAGEGIGMHIYLYSDGINKPCRLSGSYCGGAAGGAASRIPRQLPLEMSGRN
jgi:hypothetical protein